MRSNDDVIYKHFHGPGYHGLSDLSIQIIGKVNNKDAPIAKVGQWAYGPQSLRPDDGLNDSHFFFSQNCRSRNNWF